MSARRPDLQDERLGWQLVSVYARPAVTTGAASHSSTLSRCREVAVSLRVPTRISVRSGVSHLSQRSSWYVTRPPVKGAVHDVWSNDGAAVWAVGEKGSIVRSLPAATPGARRARQSRAVRTSKRSRCSRTVAASRPNEQGASHHGQRLHLDTDTVARGDDLSLDVVDTDTLWWAPAMDGCFEAMTPVCHGGEVSASARSVSGTVLDPSVDCARERDGGHCGV